MPWALPFVTEFWDARTGISQGTATERVSAWAGRNGFATLSQGTAANQPILLPYSGTAYCWNAAVAGNTLSTPTVSITGNWTLTLSLAEADYTPASDITLCDKTSGNNGFKVVLLTTGKWRVVIGDGAALTNFDTAAQVPATDFTRYTWQIVYTDNTNYVLKKDGVTVETVTVNKVLTNAATAFLLGPWDGKLYSYSLTNGAGTTYYGKDLTTLSEGAANFTDDTGATVTFNSTGAKPAQIVGSQQLLFDGAAHYLATASFALAQPHTLLLVFRANSFTNSDGIYGSAGSNAAGLLQNGASPTLSAYAGSTIDNATFALNTYAVCSAVFNGASSSIQRNLAAAVTGDAGSGAISGGLILGSWNDLSARFGNLQAKSFALCNTALSTAQLNQLIYAINSQYWVF